MQFETIEELRHWTGHNCAVVFGSYCAEENEEEYQFAMNLGKALAERRWSVCSGGYTGVMDAALKGAIAGGGRTAAVLTDYFQFIDLAPNPHVQAAITVSGLVGRMTALVEIGRCFIGLKGGTGTLAEIAIATELVNKDWQTSGKMVVLDKFWKCVLEVIGDETRPFHPDQHVRDIVFCVDNLEEVLQIIDSCYSL